jgi:hypothetical protein
MIPREALLSAPTSSDQLADAWRGPVEQLGPNVSQVDRQVFGVRGKRGRGCCR